MTLHADILTRAGTLEVSCDLEVRPGNAIALVGASGAGKTTVLRAIAGLAHPQRGRITQGEHVWFDADKQIFVVPQRRDCAMVFAEYALFGHMSSLENVAFGLRASGRDGNAAIKKAKAALELVGVSHLVSRRASKLSSGEAQRVAIARALVLEPGVLLLDEPLSAIDVEQRPPVREALQRTISQMGMCAVLVTHDPVEAMLFSDMLVIMESGRMVQTGSPAELRDHPFTSYVAAFTGVNLFRGSARPLEDGVSEVEVDGARLVIAGSSSGPITLVVDPDAVVISRTRPQSSARNSLPGKVRAILPDGASLRVSIASRPQIAARITKQSAHELGLVPGSDVYATFKASEIRVH